MYKLTFATMRERFRYIPVPLALAKLFAMPRERLYKSARPRRRPLLPSSVLHVAAGCGMVRHAVAPGSVS